MTAIAAASGEYGTALLRTSVGVDLRILEANYRAVQAIVSPHVAILCVIKADAYGHGAVEAGRKLQSVGAAYFGVATTDEGKELRENGVSLPILVLSGIMPWEPVEQVIKYDLTPVVASFDALERLSQLCSGVPINIHVKIDTGMGRLGFGLGELERLAGRLKDLGGLRVEGLMSHFASSDTRDDYGMAQVRDFTRVVDFFKEKGIIPKFIHMANSGAICNYPEAHFTMVRPGIMLYGSYPDPVLHSCIELGSVMTWSSKIALLKSFPPEASLSYGRTYITSRPTRVAYIPVGYADGYPRALSNCGNVLVHGCRCPIIGRVCMDWVFVDVTGVPEATVGDEVVLLGGQGDAKAVRADEIAGMMGTIPYEIYCGISRRIPRRYVF